ARGVISIGADSTGSQAPNITECLYFIKTPLCSVSWNLPVKQNLLSCQGSLSLTIDSNPAAALEGQLKVEGYDDEGYDVSLGHVSLLPGDSQEHAWQVYIKEEDCPSESHVSEQNWRLPTPLALSSLSGKRSAAIPNPLKRDRKKRRCFCCSPCEEHRTRVGAEHGKCFAQKRGLTMSLRVRPGEKWFKCPKCEKCFVEKQQLLRHQETHVTKPPCLSDIFVVKVGREDCENVCIRAHTGLSLKKVSRNCFVTFRVAWGFSCFLVGC
uniref:C2H2-type domain-containing protein n=1 Tax=Chelydra serpentina TaxID=8475 RepID=A0A8C3RZ79_CHESE